MIPAVVERRARWVLDSIGATELGFGDDLPYDAAAWEQIDRGERPVGDELADGFFHLARVEERNGPRDEHGRFRAEWSCLDPLDPPLERLRRRLGVTTRDDRPRFTIALTHDVDTPWRWTRIGLRGAAARLKQNVRHARLGPAVRETTGLATAPLHRLRGTDPNWRFEQILAEERRRGATGSSFYVIASHHDPHDGAAAEAYGRLRRRLVETLLEAGGEVGLHGSYTTADDPARLAAEKHKLEALAGPITGHRYHYLRVDPHRNLAPLADVGLRYDTTLGFPDALGFRAGIARPFRPWDFEREEPLDLIEVPLAAMDATLAEERYLGLAAKRAEPQLMQLLDRAAEFGGAFAVLWHPDRFDPATSGGWDRLYSRLLAGAQERGGSCVPAAELVSSHST
ncbi:MAG: polysaccharide deacetylase family protein [Gaiellaceae bacterium]